MIRLLFCCCLTFILVTGSAQDFELQPIPAFVDGIASDQPLIAFAEITNLTDTVQTVIWKRTMVDAPASWTTNICTPLGCAPETVSEGNFPLLPGETLNIDGYFNTTYETGSGTMEVEVALEEDSLNIVTAIYEAQALTASLSNIHLDQSLLYPNPAFDFFQIKGAENFEHIKIINIFGEIVMESKIKNDLQDVTNLSKRHLLYYIDQ